MADVIRLYHRTSGDAVSAILLDGFRDGEDGVVWFSEALDCWGEQGRWLIGVDAEMTRAELATYAIEAVADEVWDREAGDFVQVQDEALIERFTWYMIPAARINAVGPRYLLPAGYDLGDAESCG